MSGDDRAREEASCLDLVSFADGELGVERAAQFRDHLRTCEACQLELIDVVQRSARISALSGDKVTK